MTVARGSGCPSPWFRRRAGLGPAEAAAEEARQWEDPIEARALPAGLRGPADESPSFWSPTPVLGFRLWYVFSNCLQGVRQTWGRPALEAVCIRGKGAPHAGGGCHCGIYALKAPDGLWQPGVVRMRPGAGIAYGLVALSGRVVEHEHGYRGARAEAVAMVVHYRGAMVCTRDRGWIRRLFQGPERALEEVGQHVWPGAEVGIPSTEKAIRFLRDEARRLERAWISASRSG